MTGNEHPYKDLEGTDVWLSVEKAISNLLQNQDIDLLTKKEYVIGYISRCIVLDSLVDKDELRDSGTE